MTPNDFSGLAWAQTWQLTLLIVATLVLTRGLGRNRPHITYVLWLVVIFKCVTPPLWTSPSGVFCWLQPRAPSASPLKLVATTPRTGTSNIVNATRVEFVPEGAGHQSLPSHRADPTPSPLKAAEFHAAASSMLFLKWMVAIWLVGSATILCLAAVRWRRCWRTILSEPTESRNDLQAMLEGLRRRLGVRTAVRLVITASRIGPAVVGVWRPLILLPACIVHHKSPRELEPVLAHELIHVRRGDLWIGLAQILAQSLWWFHPLVWVANRLLSRDAERCCDEEVIAELGCQPACYARSLLDVLELKRTLQPVPVFPGVRPVEVTSQRLERIMQLGQGCHKRTPWWCWLVMLLLGVVALPGAAFVAAGDKDKPTRRSSDAPYSKSGREPTELSVAEVPTSIQTYHVRDALTRIQNDLHETESDAKRALEQFLRAERTTGVQPQLSWAGRKLVVQHTAAGHERLAKAIQFVRDNGIIEILIEVHLISGPQEMVDRLHTHWEILDSPISAGEVVGNNVISGEMPALFADKGSVNSAVRQASVAESIEKRKPALCAVIDPGKAAAILENVRANPKNLMTVMAPKITTFAGQTASIQDISQRPFVVGFKQTESKSLEPQIRFVSSGLGMHLLAMPHHRSDEIRLDCQLEASNIRDVELKTVTLGPDQQPLTVQVPEVVSTRIQLSYDFPLGQTLLIGGLSNKTDEGKSQSTLVMVRCTKFDRAAVAPASQATPASAPVTTPYLTPPPPAKLSRPAILPSPADEKPDGRVQSNLDQGPPIFPKTYYVADLVVPIPNLVKLAIAPTDSGSGIQESTAAPPKAVSADFDTLIDLIEQTIQPDTWSDAGGPGAIEPFPTNLSLVISQSEEVHHQIAQLIGQLRRLQDIQVTLEIRVAGVPKELALERTAVAVNNEAKTISGSLVSNVQQPSKATSQFLDAIKNHPQANTIALPKVTLFNGQTIDLQVGSKESVRLRSVVSPDGRHVIIGTSTGEVAANSADSSDVRDDITIVSGETLLFDMPEALGTESPASTTEQSVPFLSNVPYLGKLFTTSNSHPIERKYLLVTPRIIFQEESQN